MEPYSQFKICDCRCLEPAQATQSACPVASLAPPGLLQGGLQRSQSGDGFYLCHLLLCRYLGAQSGAWASGSPPPSSPSKLTSTDFNLHIRNQPHLGGEQVNFNSTINWNWPNHCREKFEIFVTLKAPLFSTGLVNFFTQEPRCLSCCSTPPSHYSFTFKTFLQLWLASPSVNSVNFS